VAGYVCRKVQGNIKKSSLEEKEDMMFLIMELSGDETCDAVGTESWTNSIDRGGLWHVNDNTYTTFYLIEEEIRHHFRVHHIKSLDHSTKENVMKAIMENGDILFYWSLLSDVVDDKSGALVLKMIAELYLTVRGFAFASSCLELYKQQHRKQIQKSKALRRDVSTSSTDHD
jgi:hypothetical protein